MSKKAKLKWRKVKGGWKRGLDRIETPSGVAKFADRASKILKAVKP